MIRVACLGAGYFSQFHRDGWDRISGATCVGVADQDIEKARASGLPAFGNLMAILDAKGKELDAYSGYSMNGEVRYHLDLLKKYQ